jgi:hypothetical protein
MSLEPLEKLDEASQLYEAYLAVSRVNDFPSMREIEAESQPVESPASPIGLVLTAQPLGLRFEEGSR